MQNYALRVILRKPPLTSSELLWQTLGWTTLKIRCHNAMLCQVHHCCIKQALYLCTSAQSSQQTLTWILPGPEALTSCTCQGQELIFFTQALSFKELCILTNYQRISISESSRIVSYLKLLYISITIMIC